MSKKISLARLLACASLLAALGGCAVPIYVAPEGAPTATLKSRIAETGGSGAPIDIWRIAGCGIPRQQQLFKIEKSVATPSTSIAVEADEPQTLVYFSSGYGGYCKIVIEATFEAGKAYSLVGGPVKDSASLLTLLNRQRCVFGIHNDTDNKPLPVSSRCSLL